MICHQKQAKKTCQHNWFVAVLILCFTVINQVQAATPIANYSFDEVDWVTNGFAVDSISNRNATITGAVSRLNSDKAFAHTTTCAGAQLTGGALDISGLPVSITAGDKTSVSFWMYWDGKNSVMPMGWIYHDLWLINGSFGFNSASGDLYGISSSGLANGWHHVAAVFTNGNLTDNELYIDGAKQTLTQRRNSPNNARAYVNARLRIGGWNANNSYRFSGAIDEFKVYNGALDQTEVNADLNYTSPAACIDPPPQPEGLIASYSFNDEWSTTSPLQDSTGSSNGTISGAISRILSPPSGNKPETCAAGQFSGGAIDIYKLPVSTGAGDKTSISFWMNWNGSNSVMPLGFNIHDLWFYGGNFGFNTGGGDIYGFSSLGLANTWRHVTVIFTNNNISDNKIYIDGVSQPLSLKRGTISNSRAVVNPHLRLGGWWVNNGYRFRGQLDEVKIYTGEISQTTIDENRTTPSPCYEPIAEYRFDEASWNGTAEEIIDSGSNNYNGTAINGTDKGDTNPAIPGTPGTCAYGEFDGKDDHLILPKMPNLTESFTVTAWIKSTKSRPGRIFADDDNNSRGYALSLNDPGSGKLRFFSRGVRPVSLDTKSSVIPQDDQWYFVTAVHDFNTKQRFIYVNGDLKASGTYTGTWGSDSGVSTIGGESNASREGAKFAPFKGNIDELKVFPIPLNQKQIKTVMAETHICPPPPDLDHFQISYAKAGLTCLASSINIKVCADVDCKTVLKDDVDITLSPATGWVNNPVTISNGQATLSLNHPIPGNTTLAIKASSIATANAPTCLADNSLDPTCTINVAEAGFVFDIPTLTACKASADVTIRAVKQGNNTTQCVSALTGNKTLSFWSEYDIPSTGQNKVQINGKNIATSSPGSNIDLTFDINGEAKFTAQYNDAGRLNLTTVYDDGNGLSMTGTDIFVSTPVMITSYSDDNSAECLSQNANCSIFKKAGESFELKVKAACWTDDADTDYTDNPETPNFVLADIGINHNVIAPATGINGAISQTSLSFSPSDNGIHTLQQTLSEVGVFEFGLILPNYLGETLPSTKSPAIGRFIPDHFETTTGSNGTFGNSACTGFSYSGQTFSYQTKPQLIVTAYSAANPSAITQNYRGDFAKLNDTDFTVSTPFTDAVQLGADGSTLVGLDWQAATATVSDNNNGSLTFTFGDDNYSYRHEGNSQIAPFNNTVNLIFTGIRDSDNISATTLPYTLQPAGEPIRFGRIALDSAHGSELAPLNVGLRTEFFNGVGWLPNTQDQCTSLSLSNHLRLTTDGGSFQPGNSIMTIQNGTTSATLINPVISGNGGLSLSAPGQNNQGYVDIQTNIATTHRWLLGDYDNSGIYNDEARSRASFGLFKGEDSVIFRRELY